MSTSYHKGNVRADMVREGLRILAEEGLEAVTLRRLAREIGIAPSSIYNHFANRRALLATLAQEGFKQLLARQQEVFDPEPDFIEAMKAAAREYLLFANRNQHLYRLMFSWQMGDAKDFPDLARAGYNFISESAQWWYGEPYDATSKFIADYPGPLMAWAAIHGLAMLVIQQNVALEGRDEAALTKLVDDFQDSLTPALVAARKQGVRK